MSRRTWMETMRVTAVMAVLAAPLLTIERMGAQAPQRDSAPVAIGAATITGFVRTDEISPRPLRRAKVTVASGLITTPKSVLTDDNGAYVVSGLTPGNYTLVASRPGYIDAAYGSKRIGSTQGVPVAVADGQVVTGIDVRLARGSVVTGTVRSQTGQPVTDFQVQVVPVTGVSIEQLARQVTATATTDDRGVYRVYGLIPGDYLVVATPSSLASQEMKRVSAEELRWAQGAASASASAAGLAGANVAPMPPAPAAGSATTYATVFHPGTADPAGATVVHLAAGEERSAVDLTTVLVPTARVAGTLADVDGQPVPNTAVMLQRLDAAQALGPAAMMRLTARTNTSGQFSTSNVVPGRYRVSARSTPRPAARPATPPAPASLMEMAMTMMGEVMGGSGAFWAQEDIVVEGRDVNGIALRLQPGMKVSGRITFEGASTPAAAEVMRSRVLVASLPDRVSAADLANMMSALSFVSLKDDGTFEAQGLAPNSYRVQMMAPGLTMPGLVQPASGAASMATPAPAWVMKSVMLGGRDIADSSFELRPGEDISGVVVTMTDRLTEIAGRVIDGAGRPAPGYPIVVFSTDRRTWTFASRRIQQARPASDGRYRISGLPAGEYFVCAATEVSALEMYTPEFLEQLVPGAFKITLADGERKTQDLKLGGG